MAEAAVVIAGGQGARLGGVVKPLLRLADGRTLLDRTAALCVAAGAEPVAVNAPAGFPWPLVVSDRRHGCGPLAGIEAALTWAAERGINGVLLLPGDLPCLGAAEVVALLAAFRASGGVQVAWSRRPQPAAHPLCAVAATTILPAVTAALDAGQLAIHRLWQDLGAGQVWFADDAAFANCNTPQERKRLGLRLPTGPDEVA